MSNIIETQYDEICETCDAIINQNINEPNRIANNWLHVIRYHPMFLKNYRPIFEINNSFIFYFSCFAFNKFNCKLCPSSKFIIKLFTKQTYFKKFCFNYYFFWIFHWYFLVTTAKPNWNFILY